MNIIYEITSFRNKILFNKSERTRKVIVNASNSFFIKIFSIVANFSLIAISIDCVNAENFGVWLTISSVITWISVFDLGLISSLRNKITETFAYNDLKSAQIYISTTYAILLLLIIPVWVIFLLINPYINWQSIFNTTISGNVLKPVVLWVFSSFCLQFLLKPISSILAGDQKHYIDSIITLISNAICVIILLLFKPYFKDSIYLLSVLLAFLPCIILALSTCILFNVKYKKIRPTIAGVDFKYRKQLLGVGFKFFIIQVAGLVMYSSNNFIIAHLLGNAQVTVMNIVFRYFSILTILYSLFNAPIWTAYAEAFTLKDWQWIKNVTRKSNQLCAALLSVTLIMLAISPWVYKLWINNSVHIPFSLSLLMAFNVGITFFATTYTSFINGTGKIRLQTIISIATSLIHIPLGYFLIKMLGFGLNGLVVLLIIWSTLSLIIWRIQYSKIINQSIKFIWN